MRLFGLALVAALAARASADAMASYTECTLSHCSSHQAVWYTDYDSQDISADEGCRTGASGMREFCVDWGNGRGHFFYGNGPKRCF
ncbi:hypothetical protein N657DRAFT_545558, partial [Parathielavia appendiculata]